MLRQLDVPILFLLLTLSISIIPIHAQNRRFRIPFARRSHRRFASAGQANVDQAFERPNLPWPLRLSNARSGGGWNALLNSLGEYLEYGRDEEYFGSRDLIQENITVEFIKLATLEPGQNLLDLACGTGAISIFAKTIVGPEGNVVGVDDRAQLLKRAEREAMRQRKRISFLPYNIANLSGFNVPVLFDVITCASETALLTNERETMVKEWASFLKPDGKIIVDVPAEDSNLIRQVLQQAARDLGLTLALNSSWVTGPEAVKDLLESAGLDAEVFEPPVYGSILYGEDIGLKVIDQILRGPFASTITDDRLEPLAKQMFLTEFKKQSNSEGLLVENIRSYIGVGKRKE